MIPSLRTFTAGTPVSAIVGGDQRGKAGQGVIS